MQRCCFIGMVLHVSMPLWAVNYRGILVPKMGGVTLPALNDTVELLDIDQPESLEATLFSEMIEDRERQGLPYFLARVVTKGVGTLNVHYYDALALYALCLRKNPRGQSAEAQDDDRDPTDQQPILLTQYFSLNGLRERDASYLCAHDDMRERTIPKELFDVVLLSRFTRRRGLIE